MEWANQEVRQTGYVDNILGFVSTLDPEMRAQIDPALRITVSSDAGVTQVKGILLPTIGPLYVLYFFAKIFCTKENLLKALNILNPENIYLSQSHP